MKTLFASLVLSFLPVSAFADGIVPNCWNQGGSVVDGSYMIVIGDQASRNAAKLIRPLVNKNYLKASKPTVLRNLEMTLISVKANPPSHVRMSKHALQDAVEAQLLPVTKFNGVRIECERRMSTF